MLFLILINLAQVLGSRLRADSGILMPEIITQTLIEQNVQEICHEGCPQSNIGNMQCDPACNNEECDFDGGDCHQEEAESDSGLTLIEQNIEAICLEGCPQVNIGNMQCDPACNVKECDFDGGDCGDAGDAEGAVDMYDQDDEDEAGFIEDKLKPGNGNNPGADEPIENNPDTDEQTEINPVVDEHLIPAVERLRQDFTQMEAWGPDAEAHYKRRIYGGQYRQAVWDHAWGLRWSEAEEFQGLTDADIELVIDGVSANDWLVDLFETKFGIRVPSGDRIADAAEWVRHDFSYMNSWPEDRKDLYRHLRFDERQAVYIHFQQGIQGYDWWQPVPVLDGFTEEEIWQAVDRVFIDSFIHDTFEEVFNSSYITATVDRVRNDIEHHLHLLREDIKNDLRDRGNDRNYRQAVRRIIEESNYQGLNDDEYWKAVGEIMRDDLVYRKFEEVLGVINHDDPRIQATVDRLRDDIEHNMKNWDEDLLDHMRRRQDNYYDAVFYLIERDNWEGLDEQDIYRAVYDIMRDDLVPRVFFEVLGDNKGFYSNQDPRITETVERVRHSIEHDIWNWDEGHKNHVREFGHNRNYRQAVFDCIQIDNESGLDWSESWRAVGEIMRDDLVYRKFEEALGVWNNRDHRIQETVDRVRYDFEFTNREDQWKFQKYWYWDESRLDLLQQLIQTDQDYYQALYECIVFDNQQGLDEYDTWRAVYEIMRDEFFSKFEQALGIGGDIAYSDEDLIRSAWIRAKALINERSETMLAWDDDFVDRLRSAANDLNYSQVVQEILLKDNWEKLNGWQLEEAARRTRDSDPVIPILIEELFGIYNDVEARITETVDRIRHDFEYNIHEIDDEGIKNHIRQQAQWGQYRNVVRDFIHHANNYSCLYWNEEMNRAVSEIIRDDLVPRKIDEELGVPIDTYYRIKTVADNYRDEIEHEMVNWDQDRKEEFRRPCQHGEYEEAVREDIRRENRDGLSDGEIEGASWEIMNGDDLVARKVEEVFGIPNHSRHVISETRWRVLHFIEEYSNSKFWNQDEGWRDHLRELGNQRNYRQAIWDYLRTYYKYHVLNDYEAWRSTNEIMYHAAWNDDIYKQFGDILGVAWIHWDHRIQETAERVLNYIEWGNQNWDEDLKDHLRQLGNQLDYFQAVYDIVQRENHQGLDEQDSWRAVYEIFTHGQDIIPRVFEDVLGVPRYPID